MRLFVAVDPGERFRRDLSTRLGDWPARLPVAWVGPAQWHVTLSFLGEWPEDLLAPLQGALAAEAPAHRGFAATPGRLGGFPDLRRPRVLFLHLESGGALEDLAEGVRRAIEAAAPGRQDLKPFRAHLTLARVKRPLPARLADLPSRIDLGRWEPLAVGEFGLVQSRLRPQGPEYTVLAAYPLLPAAGPAC